MLMGMGKCQFTWNNTDLFKLTDSLNIQKS